MMCGEARRVFMVAEARLVRTELVDSSLSASIPV